ncbi:MAG: DUF4177 domain-containing protein [Xanthobacteraceae bacterium]|nr:DUF4177 domain-containing protein [Xanthobacteraceae bacterium]
MLLHLPTYTMRLIGTLTVHKEEHMQVWEYDTVPVRQDSSPDEIIAILGPRGEGGWELVQMVTAAPSATWIAILKRPKVM